MMEIKGKSEKIIEILGCGPFQALLFINTGFLGRAGGTFTSSLMVFGNYNPGWICLDPNNDTVFESYGLTNDEMTIHGLSKTVGNETKGKYRLNDCSAFESCKNIEFNPGISTIVTEWSLVCGNAWIPSFMISLQMTGLLLGTLFAGVAGDTLGRKLLIYISLFFTLLLNIVSFNSTSWQMFAVILLFHGIALAFQFTLNHVYISEFMPVKWRAIILGLPSYTFNMISFSVLCMILKDWRDIHIVTCAVCVLTLIPVVWLPESLRWLEVKKKTEKFKTAAQKIAKYNGKALPALAHLNLEIGLETRNRNNNGVIRTTLHLFRKDYRKNTLLVSVPWVSVSLIYYALTFGMKALSGDFYFNLILSYVMEMVISCGLLYTPNLVGRKKAGFAFSGISGVCLLVAACFQELLSGNAKDFGVAILVMVGKISMGLFWTVLKIFMVEIYPTVIRGAANSWGLLLTRVGGIIAPILIPTEANTYSVCYGIMGVLAIICAIITLLLPETKGKALQENVTV